jgi:hypothetical protein
MFMGQFGTDNIIEPIQRQWVMSQKFRTNNITEPIQRQ